MSDIQENGQEAASGAAGATSRETGNAGDNEAYLMGIVQEMAADPAWEAGDLAKHILFRDPEWAILDI